MEWNGMEWNGIEWNGMGFKLIWLGKLLSNGGAARQLLQNLVLRYHYLINGLCSIVLQFLAARRIPFLSSWFVDSATCCCRHEQLHYKLNNTIFIAKKPSEI
jgi:hypothetical protein